MGPGRHEFEGKRGQRASPGLHGGGRGHERELEHAAGGLDESLLQQAAPDR